MRLFVLFHQIRSRYGMAALKTRRTCSLSRKGRHRLSPQAGAKSIFLTLNKDTSAFTIDEETVIDAIIIC